VTTASENAKSEAEIRALIARLARAFGARDLEGLMSMYAPELVEFDVAPAPSGLPYETAEVLRKVWREAFESFEGPLAYEIRDLGVTAGDDLAFSHALSRIDGTLKNGRKPDLWVRWTACYRKTGREWRSVHVHVSVPMDMATGKAARVEVNA
jgi:ketosteroid isomerase-like protein